MSLRASTLLCSLSLTLPACTGDGESGPTSMPPQDEGDGAGIAEDGGTTDGDAGTHSADEGPDEGPDDDPDEGPDDGSDGSDDGATDAVPEFGTTFTVIGTSGDGLNVVRDLEFNPNDPTQLWTASRMIHGSVLYTDPGTETQSSEVRVDLYAQHFMAQPSSFAMGDNGFWACCNESRNEWNGGPQAPDDFMGPSLWSSDLSVHAVVNQGGGGEGSHMDMLHQSPLCMGIAYDSGNKYWAFDGLNGHIVFYDFAADHGPGGSDHSDGTIRRYTNATVTRVPDVPSHLELDHNTGILFVADTGGGRVMALDTSGGAYAGSLPGNWDGLSEYSEFTGATWQQFAGGLSQPSGLALHEERVLVSDHATNEVVAFDVATGEEIDRMQTDAAGIMGITVGPNGRLWYADGLSDEIVRVDP